MSNDDDDGAAAASAAFDDFLASDNFSYQNQSDLQHSRQSLVTRERSSVRHNTEQVENKSPTPKRTLVVIALILVSYMVLFATWTYKRN